MAVPRVLVVDDEVPIRSLLCTLLSRSGISASSARDGQEAIEMLRAEHFDAVLLDLMMPVMSGFDVLRAAASDLESKLVVVITAGTDAELEHLPQDVVHAVIRKPFDVEVITEVFSTAVRNFAEAVIVARQSPHAGIPC